jgi:mannose/cellobiose epimerase-like protein (N-acyl-D-glucosamine 2-epimerase family)
MRADLLRFAARSRDPLGFGWLDEQGLVDPSRTVQLWITCRMTHVFSLAVLAGEPPAIGGPDLEELRSLATHGVASLRTSFADAAHGGWFAEIGPDGPVVMEKSAYAHAFVVLAASSAVEAGLEGADALLADALEVSERRFWDEAAGMVVDSWDRGFTSPDPYRGINSTMHTVEAYLAAADVTGDVRWLERAVRMASRLSGIAAAHEWRIPEHFDASWTALPAYNRDDPADPFRPYGATVGHGLEWARLLAATGATGFVYTTDWDGTPVVRNRMHWVVAEALNTGRVLDAALGEPRYASRLALWWEYADQHLVDAVDGSWHHELAPDNAPTAATWSGKPDVYHAYQAALVPTLPITPVLSRALAERRVG